jgi:hypothetical protein
LEVYLYYENKEKIRENFNIFTSDVDCIVHFFSIDAVAGTFFDRALYSLYEDAYEKIYNLSFEGSINRGQILPFRKLNPLPLKKSNPIIIHVPFKESYIDQLDIDFLRDGLNKLSHVLNNIPDFQVIKKIGIQKTNESEFEIITQVLNEIDLPEIIIFNNNNNIGVRK